MDSLSLQLGSSTSARTSKPNTIEPSQQGFVQVLDLDLTAQACRPWDFSEPFFSPVGT